MTLATRPSESVLEVTTLIAPLPAVMVKVTVILLNDLPFSSRISTTKRVCQHSAGYSLLTIA